MKELKKKTLNVTFVRSDPFHSIEEAGYAQQAFKTVASKSRKIMVSQITKGDDLMYYVDTLTRNNEENNEYTSRKEEAHKVLAGISKAISFPSS